MSFGAKIKALRLNRKLLQGEVGTALGIAQGYLSRLELDAYKPRRATIERFAAYFDVPIEYFDEDTNSNESPDEPDTTTLEEYVMSLLAELDLAYQENARLRSRIAQLEAARFFNGKHEE